MHRFISKMLRQTKSESFDEYNRLFSTSNVKVHLGRKAVRGGAAVMGAELASLVLRIGSMPVLARLLMPEDFGLLAMVTALTVFAERFKDIGLGDATVQTKIINHQQVSALFWINFSICVGIAILLTSLSNAIAWFYDDVRLTAISLVLASTFVFSGLVIQHQAILQRQLRFGMLAAIRLVSTVLSLTLSIIIAYYGFGYWALVIREFLRALFVAIGTWLVCSWTPCLPRRGVDIAHLISFGKNITGFNVVHFFSQSLDKILLGKLQGPNWVGLYTNASQLIALPINQIQYPVNTIALPALSAIQTDSLEFRAYFEKMVQLLTFFCMPLVVFLALFADIAVNLLLGTRWVEVIPIFRILAIGAFIEPLVHASGPALVAYGKTKEYFTLGLINAIILITCVFFGSFWGVLGVASGRTLAIYLAFVTSFSYGLRHTPIQVIPVLKGVLATSLCSILTALTLYGLRYLADTRLEPQWLILFSLVGTFVYLLLWLLMPGGKMMLHGYCYNFKQLISNCTKYT